jgi:hypothetical protein
MTSRQVAPSLEWDPVVLLAASAAGADPRTFRPGRDLVLDLAREQGAVLPVGVLLDDCLSSAARARIDGEASAALASWRERRDADLTVDGVCLPHIWQVELLAEVFLPETRIAAGLSAVFAVHGPQRIELNGIDAGRAACLGEVLGSLDVAVEPPRSFAAPPRYPGVLASPWRIPVSRRIAASIFRTVGIPQRVRGEVILVPYWHLRQVFERLTLDDGPKFVVDPASLPSTTVGTLIRSVARGGWVGHPSIKDRRLSKGELARALAKARGNSEQLDPLNTLLDTRALALLEQRADETLARIRRMRRAFAVRTVKLAVLPNDSMPDVRMIIQAARDNQAATLVVQHGFLGEPNDPDKTLADAVAVWSENDARRLATLRSGRIVVTGNPGVSSVAGLAERSPRLNRPGSSLVLVEYASRLSTRSDNRVSVFHVDTALRALAQARPGTAAVIRPHPAEHEPEIFDDAGASYEALRVRVDSTNRIATLIAEADLCIAAVSTAALEAAVAGVPVIFLNVDGHEAPWPFDGSTDVPVARSSEELAALIPEVLGSGEVPGRAEMVEALGGRMRSIA